MITMVLLVFTIKFTIDMHYGSTGVHNKVSIDIHYGSTGVQNKVHN